MGLVAQLLAKLNPLIRQFVDPIQEDQVSLLPLLRGELRLERLQFNQTILAALGVPLSIDVSFIGRVGVRIPIANLLYGTTNIKVQNVLLVMDSVPPSFWDSHKVLSQIQATKEAMSGEGLEGFSSLPLEGGFLWKVIQRLAHNVVVEIEDVEVRVEDTSVAPLAMGARIHKLTVKNQGPNRSLRSLDHSVRWNLLCETVTVDGLGIYIDQLKPEDEILRLRRSRLEREIHATRRTRSSGSRSMQSLGSSSSMTEVESAACGWCNFRASDKVGGEDAALPAVVVCLKDIPVDLRCSPPYRSLLEAHCITEEEEVFFDAAETVKPDGWCSAAAQVEEPVRVSPLVDFDPITEMFEKDSESDRIGDLIRRQLRFKPSEVPHAEVIIEKLINGLCHWWVLEPRSLSLDLSVLPFPQAHKEPLVKLWSDSTGAPGLFPVARADIHLEDLAAKADIRQLLGLIRWFEGSLGLWLNWQQGLTSLVEHSRSTPEEAHQYQAAFCRRLLDPTHQTEDDTRLMEEYQMQYSSAAVNFLQRQAVQKVQVAQSTLQPSKASFFARWFGRAASDELEESLMRSVSAILDDIPSDQVVKFNPLTTGADFYLDLSLLRVNVAITVPQQAPQDWLITKSLEAALDAVHLVVNSDTARFKLWLGVEVYPLRVVLADLKPTTVDVYPVVVSRGALGREWPSGDEARLTRQAIKKMTPVLKVQLELSTFVAPPHSPMSMILQTNEPLAIIADPSRLVQFGALALIAMQVMDSMQTQEAVDRLTLQLAAWGCLYAGRVSAGSSSHVNLNFQVQLGKPVAVLITKDSGDLAKEALCLSIDSLSLQSDVQPTRDVYTAEIAAAEVTDEIRLRIEGLFLAHFTDAGECLSSIGIDHTLFAAFARARSGSFISAAPACGVILEKSSYDNIIVRVCHDPVRRDVSTLHLDYWRDSLRVVVDESFVQYAVSLTDLVLSDLDLAMAAIDSVRDAHTPPATSTMSSEDSSLLNMQPLENLSLTPAFLGSLEVHVSILEVDVRLTTVADTGDSPLSRAILGVSVTKLALSSSVDMKSQTMSSQVAVGNLQVIDLSGLSPVPLRCLLRGVRRQRVPSHCIELESGLVDINSLSFCEAAAFLASDITAPFLYFSIYVDFVSKVQDLALLVRPLRVVLMWEYLDLVSTVALRLLREAAPKVSEVSEEPAPLLADDADDSVLQRQLQSEMLTDQQQVPKSTRINLRMKQIEVLISVAPCRPPSPPKTDRFSGWNFLRSGTVPLPRCLVFNASLSMDAKASHYTVPSQTGVRLPPGHGWFLGRPETSPRKRVEFELPQAPTRTDSSLDDLLPWLHSEPDDSFPTVHSLFRQNVIGPSLAFFCPSRVDITLDIDHVALAFTNLEAASAISLRDLPWKKILNDSPVLQPFRATLSGTLFFPTPIMFFERLNGINRSVSLLARHSRGFLMPNHREGFYISVHVDPIHVNLTSPNLLDLITLVSIGHAFSATMANQFPESAETSMEGASTGENYSDEGGNDVLIAPEKPVVLGGLPLCLLAFEIEVDVTLESLVVVLKGGYTQESADKLMVALVDAAGLHLVIRSPYVASHNLERDWWFGMAHYARLLDCSYNAENMRSVSFDYDKLQNPMNFTRIRKRQRYIETHKRFQALLRRIGRALRGSAREGKQGGQFESILNKGVTEARRELLNSDKNLDNRAPAWIVLHGDITVSVDYKIPDEARHMSLVEPFVLSYVAGKIAPQHPLEVVSAMSWINVNLSVAVLDTLQQAMYRYVIVNHQARESMKVSALERLIAQDSDGLGHVVYPGFVSLGLDTGSHVYHFRVNEGFDVLKPLLQALDFESMVPGVSYATLKTRALSRLLPSGGLPGVLASEPSRGPATIANSLGQVIGIRVDGNVKLVEDGSATSLTAAEMGDFKILIQLDRQVYILPSAWVDWTPGNITVVTLRLRALQESRSYLDVLIRGLTPATPHGRQVVLTAQTGLRNLSGCAVIVQPRFHSDVFATAATEPESVHVAASEASRDKPSRKWITFSSFVLDGISAIRRGPFAGKTQVHVPPESLCPLPLWWLFGSSTELLVTLDEGSEGELLLDPSVLRLMGTCESRLQDDETDERSMNLNTYPSGRVNLTRGSDNFTLAVTLAVLSSLRKKNATRGFYREVCLTPAMEFACRLPVPCLLHKLDDPLEIKTVVLPFVQEYLASTTTEEDVVDVKNLMGDDATTRLSRGRHIRLGVGADVVLPHITPMLCVTLLEPNDVMISQPILADEVAESVFRQLSFCPLQWWSRRTSVDTTAIRSSQALTLTLEVSPLANDRFLPSNLKHVTRLSGRSSIVRAALFAPAWISNRNEYPVAICADDIAQMTVAATSRSLLSNEYGSSCRLRVPNVNLIAQHDRYGRVDLGRVFRLWGTKEDISKPFTVRNGEVNIVTVPRSTRQPQLSYAVSMYPASSPFIRTTVVDIHPAFTLINNKSNPMWIREDPYILADSRLMPRTSGHLTGYMKVPALGYLEFHPQLSCSRVMIQLSGVPDAEEYFLKVMRPMMDRGTMSPSIDIDQDVTMWSVPVDVSTSTQLQIMHPGEPLGRASSLVITEVQVSLVNGCRLLRFSTPTVPEFRFVNLSNTPLGVSQEGVQLMIPLPPQDTKLRTQFHILLDSQNAHHVARAQALLEERSTTFAWFSFFSGNPKVLDIWAIDYTSDQTSQTGHTGHDSSEPTHRGGPPSHLLRQWMDRRRQEGIAAHIDPYEIFSGRHKRTRTSLVLVIPDWQNSGPLLILAHFLIVTGSKWVVFQEYKGTLPDHVQEYIGGHPESLPNTSPTARTSTVLSVTAATLGQNMPDGLLVEKYLLESPAEKMPMLDFNSDTSITFSLEGAGVAIISSVPVELLYVSLKNLDLNYQMLGDQEVLMTVDLGWVQADSSPTTRCDTILRPITGNFAGKRSLADGKVAHFDMLLRSSTSTVTAGATLIEFPKLEVDMAPMSIHVSMVIVRQLLFVVDNALQSIDLEVFNSAIRVIEEAQENPGGPEWIALHGPVLYRSSVNLKVFISGFEIAKLAFVVNVSNPSDATKTDSLPKNEVIRAAYAALDLVAAISDAQIVFSKFSATDLCGSADELIEDVVIRYATEGAKQLHKVLGAIDMLGNPALVIRRVLTGCLNGRDACFHAFKVCRQNCQVGQCCLYCGRSVKFGLVGVCSGAFECSTRITGSCFNLFHRLSNTGKYVLYPQLAARAAGEGRDELPPKNIPIGFWKGCKHFGLENAVSIAHCVCKPRKGFLVAEEDLAYRMNQEGSVPSTSAKVGAACTGVCGGVLSGFLSLLGVFPGSCLICCTKISAGFLNQLISLPMVATMRPARSFAREDCTGYDLASSLVAALVSSLKLSVPGVMFALPLPSRQSRRHHAAELLVITVDSIGVVNSNGYRWQFLKSDLLEASLKRTLENNEAWFFLLLRFQVSEDNMAVRAVEASRVRCVIRLPFRDERRARHLWRVIQLETHCI